MPSGADTIQAWARALRRGRRSWERGGARAAAGKVREARGIAVAGSGAGVCGVWSGGRVVAIACGSGNGKAPAAQRVQQPHN